MFPKHPFVNHLFSVVKIKTTACRLWEAERLPAERKVPQKFMPDIPQVFYLTYLGTPSTYI
jgi:hypothetical protein